MRKSFMIAGALLGLLFFSFTAGAQKRAYRPPEFAYNWSRPGQHPDHIVLNLTDDPATGISVTWRTSTAVTKGYAEIALATAAPKFWRNARTIKATSEVLDAEEVQYAEVVSIYHSVTFHDLLPDTLYAYRVGDGAIWSEWIQFRTASKAPKPFAFLYVGDAQNFILELWARLIREGYRKAPDAGFIIHAGDLVNNAHSERQWHEWFMAGGWIHRMLPSLPVPGNHEYQPRTEAELKEGIRELSVQWKPQFTLPENGPEGLEETVYYLDYQGARLICLDSNRRPDDQAAWLEQVLADNPNTWTVVTFHHPIYSASAGRDNAALRALWKPLFDKYGVDIVLQGHDHSYARGRTEPPGGNLLAGINKRTRSGTMYVVSVSGGKMYHLRPNGWDDFEGVEQNRAAENTQLFQVIRIDGDTLSFEAYTATGELYDAFDLIKTEKGKPNRFIERRQQAIPARSFDNTIPYYDQLPEELKKAILARYKGYQLEAVQYYDDPEFNGYRVQLHKENKRVYLTIDPEGNILEEKVMGG